MVLAAWMAYAETVSVIGRDIIQPDNLGSLIYTGGEDLVYSTAGSSQSRFPFAATACSVYAVVVPGQIYTLKTEGLDVNWKSKTTYTVATPRAANSSTGSKSLGDCVWARVNKVSSNIRVTGNVLITFSTGTSAAARADTTTILSYIPANSSETQMGIFTVPAGEELQIKSLEVGIGYTPWTIATATGSSTLKLDSTICTVSLFARKIKLDTAAPDTTWRLLDYLSLMPKYGPAQVVFPEILVVPEMSDVVIRAQVVGSELDVRARLSGRTQK